MRAELRRDGRGAREMRAWKAPPRRSQVVSSKLSRRWLSLRVEREVRKGMPMRELRLVVWEESFIWCRGRAILEGFGGGLGGGVGGEDMVVGVR